MKIFSSFAFAIFSIIFLAGCSTETVEPDPQVLSGGNAPDFSLKSLNGSTVSLSDFAGKPLVIFFFGNSCPLCISSAPDIETDIAKTFSSNEMAIIGIDVWNGNESSVANFKTQTGVSFNLLLDGSVTGTAYGTTYDRLVVVDKDGNIAHKGATSASKDIKNVVSVINSLNN